MDARLESVVPALRAIYREVRAEDVTFIAGSIAYNAFVSLLPILVLLTLVVSAVGSDALATRIVHLAGSYLPEKAGIFLRNALRRSTGSASISIISLVALLWGTLKIFRGLDAAFAEIYDAERRGSLLDEVLDVVVVFLALALAVVAAATVGSLFTVPGALPLSGMLTALISIVGLTLAFLPMYYVFPNVDVSFREVLPGVVFAAMGWELLQGLFRYYVQFSQKSDVYGVIGGILLFIIWLYFSSLVLLVGAAINAVLAGRVRDGGDRNAPGSGDRRPISSARRFDAALADLLVEARTAGVSDDEVLAVLNEYGTREEVLERERQ